MKTKTILAMIAAVTFSLNANAQHISNSSLGQDSTSLIPAQIEINKQNSYTSGPQKIPGRITSCGAASPETQSGSCPAGYTGSITYSRQVRQCSDGTYGSVQATSWTQVSSTCVIAPPPPPPCTTTQMCTFKDSLYQWVSGVLVPIPGTEGQGQCLQLMAYTYCNGVFQQRCNLTIGVCWNY